MVSFVHFADLHVDHYQQGKRGEKFALRVHDILSHLDTIIDFSIDKSVDFVLFAGDMYQTHTPKQEIRSEIHKRILRLVDADIPFYGIPGNHDMVKRDSSKDALYELTSLRIPGVNIFHEPGIMDCGDYAIAGVPWLYTEFDVKELDADKPVFAIVHATILGSVYGSGTSTSEIFLGREFVLHLDDLKHFTYVGLGHIHKPQVLNEDPYIIYPGSVGWQSWGEAKDDPHFFVYYNKGKVEYIEFEDRQRFSYTLDMEDSVPEMKDPFAFYKFVVPKGYNVADIDKEYKEAYSVDINVVRERKERRSDGVPELINSSPKEQLKQWFELTNQDFSEVETLFDSIADSIGQ